MRRLLAQAGFEFERAVFLCEACPDLSECGDPAEYLVIARCVQGYMKMGSARGMRLANTV